MLVIFSSQNNIDIRKYILLNDLILFNTLKSYRKREREREKILLYQHLIGIEKPKLYFRIEIYFFVSLNIMFHYS